MISLEILKKHSHTYIIEGIRSSPLRSQRAFIEFYLIKVHENFTHYARTQAMATVTVIGKCSRFSLWICACVSFVIVIKLNSKRKMSEKKICEIIFVCRADWILLWGEYFSYWRHWKWFFISSRSYLVYFSSYLSQFNGKIDRNAKNQNDINICWAMVGGWELQHSTFDKFEIIFSPFSPWNGNAKPQLPRKLFQYIFNIIFTNDISNRIGWM